MKVKNLSVFRKKLKKQLKSRCKNISYRFIAPKFIKGIYNDIIKNNKDPDGILELIIDSIIDENKNIKKNKNKMIN